MSGWVIQCEAKSKGREFLLYAHFSYDEKWQHSRLTSEQSKSLDRFCDHHVTCLKTRFSWYIQFPCWESWWESNYCEFSGPTDWVQRYFKVSWDPLAEEWSVLSHQVGTCEMVKAFDLARKVYIVPGWWVGKRISGNQRVDAPHLFRLLSLSFQDSPGRWLGGDALTPICWNPMSLIWWSFCFRLFRRRRI